MSATPIGSRLIACVLRKELNAWLLMNIHYFPFESVPSDRWLVLDRRVFFLVWSATIVMQCVSNISLPHHCLAQCYTSEWDSQVKQKICFGMEEVNVHSVRTCKWMSWISVTATSHLHTILKRPCLYDKCPVHLVELELIALYVHKEELNTI